METTIISLLVFLIGLFVGFFFRDFKSRQTDDVTESVKLFGDVRQTLGELTATTRKIEEVGRGIAELQDILKSPNLIEKPIKHQTMEECGMHSALLKIITHLYDFYLIYLLEVYLVKRFW